MPFGPSAPPHRAPTTLQITEVRLKPQNAKALLAFASVTFNDCFVVRGLKIIDGMEGRFVAMPARKKKDNTFQDIAHPITREFRAHLEHVVLEAYRTEYEREGSAAAHPVSARTVVDPKLG